MVEKALASSGIETLAVTQSKVSSEIFTWTYSRHLGQVKSGTGALTELTSRISPDMSAWRLEFCAVPSG